ncbi:MAG TPA: peptidylprolyl isomerase [Solirubrobacterales bacterium]|nr:peptidylprolyl isomerase [Solirubrobacterales bacterium]
MGGRQTIFAAVALIGALALGACGGDGEEESSAALPSGCKPVAQPPAKPEQLPKPDEQLSASDRVTAIVETSCGTFEIALDTATSPETTGSFTYLADRGFYDGTSFSYIDGSVVQGGDPIGDRTGGPGYFVDEPPPVDAEYTRGTVAMAKTEVEPTGRSGSQFFVVYAADAGLQPQFAVLGEVTEGIDVVDRIAELREPGSENGAPRAPVVIESITLRG